MSTPLPFAPMLPIPTLPKGPKPAATDGLTIVGGAETFGPLFAMLTAQVPTPQPTELPGGLDATCGAPNVDVSLEPAVTDVQPPVVQAPNVVLQPDPLGLIAQADRLTAQANLPSAPELNVAFARPVANARQFFAKVMRPVLPAEIETVPHSLPLSGKLNATVGSPEPEMLTVAVRVNGQTITRSAQADLSDSPGNWNNLMRGLGVQSIDIETNQVFPSSQPLTASAPVLTSVPANNLTAPLATSLTAFENVADMNRRALTGAALQPKTQDDLLMPDVSAELHEAETATEPRLSGQSEAPSLVSNQKSSSIADDPVPEFITATSDQRADSRNEHTSLPEVDSDPLTAPLQKTDSTVIVTDTTPKVEPSTGREELPRPTTPVQFTLPEKLSPPTNGRSHTVTIKLDPEHLGPARLHLSSQNEVISARLTVDTPEAKAVVDGSLDRLVDQLHKAGVKVHQVDVHVRGDLLPGHPHQQQSSWRRSVAGGARLRSAVAGMESEVARPLSLMLTPQVMTAERLNLYA